MGIKQPSLPYCHVIITFLKNLPSFTFLAYLMVFSCHLFYIMATFQERSGGNSAEFAKCYRGSPEFAEFMLLLLEKVLYKTNEAQAKVIFS